MAKVKGPLLSLGATGQIGKAQVFGSWRGVDYARQHVVPANPNTTAQALTRNIFAMLSERYKLSGTLARAPWAAAAVGKPLTDRNAFTKTNLGPIRTADNLSAFLGSPGVAGGLPLTAFAASTSATSSAIDATYTAPASPAGWTLDAVVATAFPDIDPQLLPSEITTEAEDDPPTQGSPTVIELVVPQAATAYVVSCWCRWTRPDGKFAYGVALTDTANSAA